MKIIPRAYIYMDTYVEGMNVTNQISWSPPDKNLLLKTTLLN